MPWVLLTVCGFSGVAFGGAGAGGVCGGWMLSDKARHTNGK